MRKIIIMVAKFIHRRALLIFNTVNKYNIVEEWSSTAIKIIISLPYGGKFDVFNNWRGSHASHRIGTNADIGFTGVDENGNCINLNKSDLREIITSNSSKAPIKEGDHYHIFVNQ